MVAKLGTTEMVGSTSSRMLGAEPPPAFDREFRNEVTELVYEILLRSYITDRDSVQVEARRWGLTVEQLVAAAVSHQVMKKVDSEYV